MPERWAIRPATEADAAGLTRCMQAAYAIYEDEMEGERLPPLDVDYAEEIRGYPTWVVELDGEIVGGLILVFEGERASLANVAVDPRFHGRGIGGGLLAHAEREARSRGYREMELATHIKLDVNVSLYEYLGWRETSRDTVRVTMRKRLQGKGDRA